MVENILRHLDYTPNRQQSLVIEALARFCAPLVAKTPPEGASTDPAFILAGYAGTGKSFVLRKIVSMLQRIKGSNSVYITASTGIAACNIGGITLHSFAGIGIGDEAANVLIKRVRANNANKERWKSCEVLFIDGMGGNGEVRGP